MLRCGYVEMVVSSQKKAPDKKKKRQIVEQYEFCIRMFGGNVSLQADLTEKG